MGLLDELKLQAEQAKQQREDASNAAENDSQLINGKLHKIFHYFRELAEQLEVIQPPTDLAFPVHGVGDMANLRLKNFSADYRRRIDGYTFTDLIDYVTLTFSYSSPQKFVVDRQESWQAERLREYLGRHSILFELEERKNPRGLLENAQFTIPWEVRTYIRVKGDEARRQIIFAMRNVERLGEQEFIFSAERVDDALLDEFVRFMLGQPNRLRSLQ
jgi:hypothetical protein